MKYFSLFLFLIFNLGLSPNLLHAQFPSCGVNVEIGDPVYANGQASVSISIDGDLTFIGMHLNFRVLGTGYSFNIPDSEASINPALNIQNPSIDVTGTVIRLSSFACGPEVTLPAGAIFFSIVVDLPVGGTIEVECDDVRVSTACYPGLGYFDTCDLCPAMDDCGVYIEETVNGNSVTVTLYHDGGTPIAMYNDPCCVTWEGVPGIPTIECPPPPGLPYQSYNPLIMALGQSYAVTITCGDCVFKYEGIAGELEAKAGDRSLEWTWRSEGSPKPKVTAAALLQPNPAKDFIQISSPLIEENTFIEIRTIEGQLIHTKISEQTQQISIPLQDFPLGIYLLSLKSKNGYLLLTKKFIIVGE